MTQPNHTYHFRIKADSFVKAEMYVVHPKFLDDVRKWNADIAEKIMFCAVRMKVAQTKTTFVKRFRFPFTLRFTFGKLFA